jgi:hypothetical protein
VWKGRPLLVVSKEPWKCAITIVTHPERTTMLGERLLQSR